MTARDNGRLVGIRVVKLGGRVQQDEALPAALAAAWNAAPGGMCVVHGGGDEISALQKAMGLKPRFLGGRRVTAEADVAVLRMALSGLSNKQLVAALVGAGVPALGISGEDAALLSARRTSDAALGLVGTPGAVNVALLRHLLAGGYLPVLSPLSRGDADAAAVTLNVNGDDAAAAVAVSLGAAELLLVADVPGVLVDGAPVASLDALEARALVASGEAAGGMAAKLEAALGALARGVAVVRVGDVAAIADASRGTSIVADSRTARASTGAAGGSTSVRSFA
jgi:acetylglutamate kinase